jgi:hypothetical protein
MGIYENYVLITLTETKIIIDVYMNPHDTNGFL